MELEKFPAISELWESFSLHLSGNCSFLGSCSLTLWSFTLEAHKFVLSQKLKRDCLKSSGTPSLCSFLLYGELQALPPQLSGTAGLCFDFTSLYHRDAAAGGQLDCLSSLRDYCLVLPIV